MCRILCKKKCHCNFAASEIYFAGNEIWIGIMGTDSELKKATEAVDEAWRQWKASPSKKSEAVYDHAYMAWKKLGGERGVGRPPGGDQAALTSTERARAARARQQQSAARWEQVAPVIQRLRSAVEAQDDVGALALAKSLVNQTT